MEVQYERNYTTGKNIDDWPFMSSYLPTFSVLGVYLLLIYKLIPSYMKNKSAYNFKKYLILYNVGQVLACYYVVSSVNSSSINIFDMTKCFLYDVNSQQEHLFVNLSYFIYWLKMIELTETIVFALRKKQNQISLLHVYHHCSTVSLAYLLAKYVRGGPEMFSVYVNSWVHIIMYSYYLIALLGENVQKKLLRFKQSITILQMLQFCILIGQVGIFLARGCNIPPKITLLYLFIVGSIFYLFYDFYKKSYNNKTTAKVKNVKSK